MSYDAMLRDHMKENNRRLAGLERKLEKNARKLEALKIQQRKHHDDCPYSKRP